jgi:hypothetical protein
MTLVWRPGFQFDADASTYIEAVEAADTQSLETGVRYAINDFVIGCKQDGIWSAIKASCILAGARTLAGALTPLAGTAPTNVNFVSGDYNRKTGLVGDGSTKYLNSNRAINADIATNHHVATYISTFATSAWVGYATSDSYTSIESSGLYCGPASPAASIANGATGLVGVSRNSSSSFSARRQASSVTVTTTYGSKSLTSTIPVFAFRNSNTSIGSYSSARLAFYSIGESLDLALLDTRVTALITAIGAAIP